MAEFFDLIMVEPVLEAPQGRMSTALAKTHKKQIGEED